MTLHASGERPAGWRLAAAVTMVSVLVSLGFSLLGLVAPAFIAPGATPVLVAPFSGYAASRSLGIAAAALVALRQRSAAPLVTVGWIASGVQALDALVGLFQGDVAKTAGPLMLAVLGVVALRRLK